MLTASKPLPAVFKMPACESTSEAAVHLGDYFIADASLMTVETCPGKILTIHSSLKNNLGDDENSWVAFFVKHALKIAMTSGLLITGIY